MDIFPFQVSIIDTMEQLIYIAFTYNYFKHVQVSISHTKKITYHLFQR